MNVLVETKESKNQKSKYKNSQNKKSQSMMERIKKAKTFDLCIIVLFLMAIYLPMVGKFLNLGIANQGNANAEKRTLTEKPKLEFSYKGLMNFSKEYDSYFNDNFGFRNILVKMNNKFKKEILGDSPSANVLLGRQDWLFYSSPTDGRSIEDYQCTDLFTDLELKKIKDKFEKQQAHLDKLGAKFILVIPPNKSTVYPEYMPSSIRKGDGKSRLDQLQEYLAKNSKLDVVDLKTPLLEAKQKYLTYYKTDTHWNSYGALVGYTEIMKKVVKYYPDIKPYKMSDFNITTTTGKSGDLAVMLALENSMKDTMVIPQPKFVMYATPIIVPYEKSAAFLKKNSKLPKLFMTRDSFTSALAPYLAENFSKSIFIWNFNFNNSIIEKEKPEVVVYEIVERYLDELLNQN